LDLNAHLNDQGSRTPIIAQLKVLFYTTGASKPRAEPLFLSQEFDLAKILLVQGDIFEMEIT
jgi:hypothetical protein